MQYLRAIGLTPPLEKFGTRPEVLGWAMSGFFGGRAEARIVRTPVPVVYADVNSTYPLVNTLLGSWAFLRAAAVLEEDATRRVLELLGRSDLADHCLNPDVWAEEIGVTLVELDRPEDQILPTRARYDPNSASHGIGINPLTYDGTLWYTLPDAIASTLLTKRPPSIRRAVRLVPKGIQTSLQPVKLRGGTPVAPDRDDLFGLLAEERRRVQADSSLPKEARDRLALFLKITANSIGYGVLARFDRKENPQATELDVYGPDERPRSESTKAPESPGPYCYPPLAATITAGARLLLSLLEHLVTQAGGAYAFCDTDSMAIVSLPKGGTVPCQTATGDTLTALSHPQVEEILDRFDTLNPFDRDLVDSVWKVEHDSLGSEPVYCYAISAKRYVVYHLDESGQPRILAANDSSDDEADDDTLGEDTATGAVDWSEHGLGLYLDPQDPTQPKRDQQGRRTWIRDAWRYILDQADDPGSTGDLPGWADRYALTRFTINRPTTEAWFRGYTDTNPDDPLRPGSFGMIAHPTYGHLPPSNTDQARPASTYEDDPSRWDEHPWYDRTTGHLLQLTPGHPEHDPEAWADALATQRVPVKTLSHVVAEFATRPEHKSLAPDGQPVTGTTHGQLQRRPIQATPARTRLVGKESNKLLQRLTGEVTEPGDYYLDLGSRESPWQELVLPTLRDMDAETLINATGDARSTIYGILKGRTPTAQRAEKLTVVAAAWALEQLPVWDVPFRRRIGPLEILTLYHRERARRRNPKVCAICQVPLHQRARSDARYCSARCRKAASRHRSP